MWTSRTNQRAGEGRNEKSKSATLVSTRAVGVKGVEILGRVESSGGDEVEEGQWVESEQEERRKLRGFI